MRHKKYPNLIGIPITDRCNQNCDFCLRASYIKKGMLNPSDDMSISQAKILADKIKGKVKMINLSAGYGETLLNKDVKEIVDVFKNAGIQVLIYSNGKILLQKPSCFFDVNFDMLVISVNKINYINELLDIIEKLPRTIKDKIIFSVLIDYHNNDFEYLVNLAEYSEKNSIRIEYHWQFKYNEETKQKKDVFDIYNYLISKNYSYIILPNPKYSDSILCDDPFKSMYFTKEGNLRGCCIFYESTKKYNVFDHDLEEIWDSNYLNTIRKQFIDGSYPTNCENCPIGFGNIYLKGCDVNE